MEWIVITPELYYHKNVVEADSAEEARRLVLSGEGEVVKTLHSETLLDEGEYDWRKWETVQREDSRGRRQKKQRP